VFGYFWDETQGGRVMQGKTVRIVVFTLAVAAFVIHPALVNAAPVTLPSGKVVELTKQQVATIKSQPGVFFGAQRADMLGPGEAVIALPPELGGGFIYGRPEALAQAFTTAGAAVGPPAEAFAVKEGLSTGAKIGIGAAVAAAIIGGIAAAFSGGGGGDGGGSTSNH
jgi:hypothetical protein